MTLDPLRALIGYVALLGVAAFCSTNRRAISWRVVGWGIGLHWGLGLVVLTTPFGREAVERVSRLVVIVLDQAQVGARFLFGSKLIDDLDTFGFIFAFKVLPTVIFVAALFAVLYHLRIMPLIVRGIAWAMARLMGTSGAESLNAVAAAMMGQTESPLTIRPYLDKLTRSELMTMMTSGMAAVAGSVLVAYFGTGAKPEHVLTAATMAIPASILFSKLFIPETETPETLGVVRIAEVRHDANLIDAAARGTREGLTIALALGSMLIAFLSLIALVNLGLAQVGLSLEWLLGRGFAPVAWMLGVSWNDAGSVGGLLGLRLVTNEIVAYEALQRAREILDPRSDAIATFALCGFANLSSIGIQIGVVGSLVPDRRADLARLGPRALLAATLANLATGCVAGILV